MNTNIKEVNEHINNLNNEVATPRVDELDYNQEIKCYQIWDLARQLERELIEKTNEIARLRELLEMTLRWIPVFTSQQKEQEAIREELAALAPAPEEPNK